MPLDGGEDLPATGSAWMCPARGGTGGLAAQVVRRPSRSRRGLAHLAVEAAIVARPQRRSPGALPDRWTLMSTLAGRPPAARLTALLKGTPSWSRRWLFTLRPRAPRTDRCGGPASDAARSSASRARRRDAVEVPPTAARTGLAVARRTRRGAPTAGPGLALLPVLDPTVMGWKERDFYLGGHGPALFDRNGNAGTRPGATAASSAAGTRTTTDVLPARSSRSWPSARRQMRGRRPSG